MFNKSEVARVTSMAIAPEPIIVQNARRLDPRQIHFGGDSHVQVTSPLSYFSRGDFDDIFHWKQIRRLTKATGDGMRVGIAIARKRIGFLPLLKPGLL